MANSVEDTRDNLMAALVCNDCERPAECSCVCRFPLPLLCEEHRLTHTTESHFPLPLNALRQVRDNATQAELNERVTKLRRLHSLLDLFSDPLQQPTIDIRDLLIQFFKNVKELKTKVVELRADSAFREVKDEWILRGDVLSCLIWSAETPESELGTWMNIAHGLSLKGEFQYEESCRVLESHWKLVHSNKKVEVLILSLILSEVMGLHIGRFEEALAILEKSLEVANELYPKSEIALQLANMKAAILIHFLSFKDCRDFCNETILNFRDTSTSEVAFGTALYFYATCYRLQYLMFEPDGEAIIKKWMLKTENSSNSLIEHIRLNLNAPLKGREYNDIFAGLVEKAEQLAKRDFSTSTYAALSGFIVFKRKMIKGEDESDSNLDEFLRTHFPKSLLHALILEHKAEFYCRMGDKDKELEARLLVHQLEQRNPYRNYFLDNVRRLTELYSGDDQAILDICESAYRSVFERSFKGFTFSSFLLLFGELFVTLNLPEKKFEIYAETVRKLQATDPTDYYLLYILKDLKRWEEDTQREKVIQLCVESYQFLRQNCPLSENYFGVEKLVTDIYMDLQLLEKAGEVFLESFQIAKTFFKFQGFVAYLEKKADIILNNFSKEKKTAILDEICAFLISFANPVYSNTFYRILKLFSEQPEKLLTILLAVYRTLLASPTDPALYEHLKALIKFYNETNQIEKGIETMLEVHQLLLERDHCDNFFYNAADLVVCYWDQNQKHKAVQFLVKLYRYLIPLPESNRKLIYILSCCCHYSKNRLDMLLESHTEAYRIFEPAKNPQYNFIVNAFCRLHYEMGNHDTAIQIAQECVNSLTVLTKEGRDNLELLKDLNKKSGKYEQIIEIYFSVIPIYLENGFYSEILGVFRSLLEALRYLKAKYEAIEKLLEVAICLNNRGERKLFNDTLEFLHDFLCYERLENEEGIRIRKKVLQYSWPLCPGVILTERLLQQIGGYYWKMGEKEKAEACFFRAARFESHPLHCYRYSVKSDYRLLFNGGDRANILATIIVENWLSK